MLVRYVFDELFHNQRHPTPLHPEFYFTLTARERNAAESHFSLLFVDVDTTESRAYHHERVDAAEAGLEKLKTCFVSREILSSHRHEFNEISILNGATTARMIFLHPKLSLKIFQLWTR